MATIQDLEERIKKLEAINNQVLAHNKEKDTDKAWETSLTRRTILVGLTYLAIGLYMKAVGISNPWVNAVVPSVGFTLSTLSLPFFKKLWLKYIYKV